VILVNIRESTAFEREVGLSTMSAPAKRLDMSAAKATSLAALTVDALLIVLTSVVTGVVYQRVALSGIADLAKLAGTGLIAAAAFCAFTRIGAVEPMRVSSAMARTRGAVTAWVLSFLLLTLVAFSLKIGDTFSRGAIFSFFFGGLFVVTGSRVFTPRWLSQLSDSRTLRGVEPIVVAGAVSRDAELFVGELKRLGCLVIHRVDFDIDCSEGAWSSERDQVVQNTIAVARSAAPGVIYISAPLQHRERLAGIVAGLRLVPRSICVVPDPMAAQLMRYSVRTVGAALALELQREPLSRAQKAIKRGIDIAFAALAVLVLSPILAVLALLIRLDSKGPALFLQTRNGLRGRPFRICKFRTMHVMEDGEEIRQAGREDQRVTRIGRLLRWTSLDEIPQLFNVLKGEMSLVGPRPHAVAHDQHYSSLIENYELRQHVKPGLTGWAQINGYRGETPTVELMYRRIEFDLSYAANASLSLDFFILLRTIPALLGQRNAY
jgi:Undecaprenyl-phosphate glucose phosphotransferase